MNATHILFAIGIGLSSLAQAEARDLGSFDTSAGKVRATQITGNLVHPWGMAFLPGGDLLVTERDGNLRILSGSTLSKPVSGVPKVAASGQGGLLDRVDGLMFAVVVVAAGRLLVVLLERGVS